MLLRPRKDRKITVNHFHRSSNYENRADIIYGPFQEQYNVNRSKGVFQNCSYMKLIKRENQNVFASVQNHSNLNWFRLWCELSLGLFLASFFCCMYWLLPSIISFLFWPIQNVETKMSNDGALQNRRKTDGYILICFNIWYEVFVNKFDLNDISWRNSLKNESTFNVIILIIIYQSTWFPCEINNGMNNFTSCGWQWSLAVAISDH